MKSTDRWRTPSTKEQPIVDLVQAALGGTIDLDPTADNEKSIPADNHFTIEDDCHQQQWTKFGTRWFMNPPFSKPNPFIEQLCFQRFDRPDIDAIVLGKAGILNNKGTGTLIRQSASAICLWGAGLASRIAFLDADGNPRKGADFDCCFVYWGPNPERFIKVFSGWGLCARLNQSITPEVLPDKESSVNEATESITPSNWIKKLYHGQCNLSEAQFGSGLSKKQLRKWMARIPMEVTT